MPQTESNMAQHQWPELRQTPDPTPRITPGLLRSRDRGKMIAALAMLRIVLQCPR